MLGNETLSRAPKSLETEADAYAFLEGLRWGEDGPSTCPHCGSDKGAWYLKPKDPEGRKSKGGSSARSQRRVWKCRENTCRRQFSVLTNTVLHATKMPVRAWIGAIVDLCEDPAGVSARDIAARWGITEKSAWAMLNRVQEALSEPEVAGAELQSNAPLWFEIDAEEARVLEQERHAREAAAVEAERRRQQVERDTAARIERDVQRALADTKDTDSGADSGAGDGVLAGSVGTDSGADSGASAGVLAGSVGTDSGADSGASDGVLAGSVDTDSGARSGPETDRLVEPTARESAQKPAAAGASFDASGVSASPDLGAPASVDAPVIDAVADSKTAKKRREPDADEQVKSDVERALAEVFGDALPGDLSPKRAAEHAENSSKTTPGQAENSDVAAVVNDPTTAATKRKSRAKERPETATVQSQEGASKAARPAADAHAKSSPQPVDNSGLVAAIEVSESGAATSPARSRAQARREQKQRKEARRNRPAMPAESLGVGWLDGGDEGDPESSHRVSQNQGKLEGIVAPDLGPSWASSEAEVSPDTHSEGDPMDHQLQFFDDQKIDGESADT